MEQPGCHPPGITGCQQLQLNVIHSNRSMVPFICKIIFREPYLRHGPLFESDSDPDPDPDLL